MAGDDDPLTGGEVRRTLARLEAGQRDLTARLADTVRDLVPAELWAAQHKALEDRLNRHERASAEDRRRLEKSVEATAKDLTAGLKSLRDLVDQRIGEVNAAVKLLREQEDKRSEITWQKWVGLISVLAAIALVLVTIIGQSKGIR